VVSGGFGWQAGWPVNTQDAVSWAPNPPETTQLPVLTTETQRTPTRTAWYGGRRADAS
jgi:hypothetical protein